MKPVFILNGPNLNMLGQREPGIYIEGELIESIHAAQKSASAIIINGAAYTHTSVALHDALRAVDVPVIEVHLSNVYKREPFRHHSYISPAAAGVICGFGAQSYELALEAVATLIKTKGKG
jgi:3-dehydroquinate dehydratase II